MFSISRATLSMTCMLSMSGCAGTTGGRPHDMSEAGHLAAASSEEKAASQHTQHDCGKETVCWGSNENPTEEQRADSQKHRKMAADHRAAAKTLGDAEASACVGISDADRDMSPFNHRADISEVTAHVVTSTGSDGPEERTTTGSDIVFRATPGMTAEWLQRVANCHIARAGAVGYNMPEMAYCPLELKNVKATVTSTGGGFAIAVTSDNPDTVKEIVRRSDMLVAKK